MQEEVEEIAALSPETSTVRLLAVEESLGDLHNKFDRMMENFELLNRRMDELPPPPRKEANVANDYNFSDRRGRRARRNYKNLHNQWHAQRGRPGYDPPQYLEEDIQEDQEVWEELQEDGTKGNNEQGNLWNHNDEVRMRRNNRRFDARREVHHDYKMKIDLPTYSGKREEDALRLDKEHWEFCLRCKKKKNIENFFNYMDTSEQEKMHLVALKLRAGALAW